MKFWIGDRSYTIEEIEAKWPNGVVIDDNIYLYGLGITRIPFKIIKCRNFDCSDNCLIDLENGPEEVTGVYDCSHNPKISLKGVAKIIGGAFCCGWCDLENTEYWPDVIKSGTHCQGNKFHDLEKPINTKGKMVKKGSYYIHGEEYTKQKWENHPARIEYKVKQILKQ